MRDLVRRHPITSYFTLAFALSWVGVLAVIWPGPIPASPQEEQRLFPFVYLAMLVGPPVAGLTMTALVSGRSGLRDYFDRLTNWRLHASTGVYLHARRYTPVWRWYAVALLTAPLTLAVTLFVLAPWSPDWIPAIRVGDSRGPLQATSISSFVVLAVLVGIGAGVFEEMGWTGFAIPTLRSRFGVDLTGLIVGLLWGAWHFLAILWGSARAFGSASVPLFMVVALFAFLPPYRILMVRVYDHTHSLCLAMLMHASLTTSMILFGPSAAGNKAIVYDLVFGTVLWIVVAATTWRARVGRLAGAKLAR